MIASIVNLPADALEEVLLFVPICAARNLSVRNDMSAVCNSLSRRATVSGRFFTRKDGPIKLYHPDSIFLRDHYQQRHVQDGITLHKLLQVSHAVERAQDYGLGSKYENPLWFQLCNEQHSFDLLRFVARNDQAIKTLYHRAEISLVTRCLATQLLELVHFRNMLQQFQSLVNEIQVGDCCSVDAMEQGAMLLAESQTPWKELIKDASPADRMNATRQSLDDLAKTLQGRLNTCRQSVNIMDTIRLLYTIMADEMEFSISSILVSPNHSLSIEQTLQCRRGSSITIAVICKSVLHRVGISVDVIPDAKRVLLTVRGDQVEFVDFLHGCQLLSYEDLRVQSPYVQEVIGMKCLGIVVKKEILVLKFMVKLLSSYCQRVMHELRSIRSFNATNRAELLKSFMVGRLECSDETVYCNEWTDVDCQYLDPEIFRSYNLINDSTMNRHNEAPWHTQQEPGW